MPEPFNAGNRKSIREAEKLSKVIAQQNREAVVAIMSTQAGRTWMHGLLEFAHIFSDPFTGQALQEAFNKGERNFGLRLMTDIMAFCPDDYIQMMREANGRRTQLDAQPESPGESGRSGSYDDTADSDAERPSEPEPRRFVEGSIGSDIYAS